MRRFYDFLVISFMYYDTILYQIKVVHMEIIDSWSPRRIPSGSDFQENEALSVPAASPESLNHRYEEV